MNLIALMQPLSLIKHLKIHLQATCVFFCATSVVQIYFINTDLIWLIDLILLIVLLVFILLF